MPGGAHDSIFVAKYKDLSLLRPFIHEGHGPSEVLMVFCDREDAR